MDFGREQSGGIRILTHGANGDKRVRLRFGESLSETCAELGEKNATNDHSNRDFTVELQNYSDMTFGNTGFRFVRLDFLGKDSGFGIKSIVAASDEDEREEVGRFECDDPVINEIWNTASRTLRLCLHNGYFWDGVKRDRLVWIGDLYPEMRSSFCLYKNTSENGELADICQRADAVARLDQYDTDVFDVVADYSVGKLFPRRGPEIRAGAAVVCARTVGTA